jgi:hypothetical protein
MGYWNRDEFDYKTHEAYVAYYKRQVLIHLKKQIIATRIRTT